MPCSARAFEDVAQDALIARHLDVRNAAHVPVVGSRKGGRRRGHDDVVAMAEVARERPIESFGLAACKRAQPGASDSHLPRVGGAGKPSKHRPVVRCAKRDHVLYARCNAVRCEPRANRQPAHAVGNDNRRPAGRLGESPDCGVDRGRIAVDPSENRLEVDRDERNAQRREPSQPGVPDTAIADEAVNEDNPRTRRWCRRHVVGNGARAKRLAPEEHPCGACSLAPPRLQDKPGACRMRFVPIDPPRKQHLRCKNEHVSRHDHERTADRDEWPAALHPRDRPRDCTAKQGKCRELLKARQHDARLCRTLEPAPQRVPRVLVR